MENLKFKNFEIEETKADESGGLTISGYGAVFGNVDSYGDIIEKGAFTKTLSDRAGRIAFCYQHDIWNPIGKIIEIGEDEKGLKVKVKISAAEEDIQTKIKEGILKEMSIGYRTVNSHSEMRDEKEVNLLTEIKLIEVSLVTVAANPLAVIEKMKGEEKQNYISKEFDRVLAIVRNDNINFEIQKLKSLVLSATPEQQQPEKQPLIISKGEIISALIGTKKELLTALNGNKN
jgi:HK97 family phage prohead protease